MPRIRYVVQATNDKHELLYHSGRIDTYDEARRVAQITLHDPCYPDIYKMTVTELPSHKVVCSIIVSQERYNASHE